LAELAATRWPAGSMGTFAPERFTSAVYREHASGKTRLSGARAVLEYFHVPDANQRAAEYAEEKQRRLEQLIEAAEFAAFPDALRFVVALRAHGVRMAAASSSRNANRFMERIRVDGRAADTLLAVFDANVSGRELPAGKPDPEIFLLAARE